MYKLVLIERDPHSYDTWPNLIKKKRIPELSVEEVVRKYQGFEGEFICIFEIKENINELQNVIEEYLELKKLGKCFVLHIISSPEIMPSFLEKQAIKMGYDVGVCEKEKTIYSSIFHEVLFGYLDELAVFKDLLNENFLFPSRSLAEKYVKVHDKMSAEGKDVEDYEEMVIYEIWEHKDSEK